jgi:hypothetical protein
VLQSMEQQAWQNPLEQKYDNDAVFRAVVRTLGSNSRQWSAFLSNEPQIAHILSDFRLEEVRRNPPDGFELARLLPGLTATADARGILNWAHRLADNHDYYASVVSAAIEMQHRFEEMPSQELFLCVVAHFTDHRHQSRKWPGMGFALGCELLRNLHWNGFKPDRHIKRLLKRWTKDQINVQEAMERLRGVIGRMDGTLSDNLKWSLIGMEITPDDHRTNLSQFDNLVWLLGAYVEKKGRESECNYMVAPGEHPVG